MKLRTVRYIFGCVVLTSHFLGVSVFFILGSRYLPNVSDVMQGVLTILPVAATYTVTFVRYVAAAPTELQSELGRAVDPAPFFVQLAVLLLFGFALVGSPVYIFLSGDFDYQTSKLVTGAVDTIFGAYLASIFGKLFPKEVYER